MKTLEEMKARLTEIKDELKGFDGLDMTNENVESIKALTSEAGELKNAIEAKEALASTLNSLDTSARKTAVEPKAAATRITGGADLRMNNGKHGFDSVGDYFAAVREFERGNRDDRLLKLKNQQQEAVGTDGGFMLPPEMISEIQKKVEGDESLASRCRQFNPRGNRVSMLVNEAAPWDGQGQNLAAEWVGETKTANESKVQLKEYELKLEKLQVKVDVTEEMLEDAPAIESYIKAEAPDVFVAAINNAIISGNGVKKPQGIINSGFGFEVAKEAGQAADTVVFENLKKLYTHALPRAKRNGIFLYNVGVEEQLIGMKLDPSSNDSVSVYLPNNSIAGAPYGTLWGKPVFPMIGGMKGLGDKGDIMFVDLSYYYFALKSGGIKQQMSIHAKWDQDLTSFKFTTRVAGGCPFKMPTATEHGDYKLSGFTYLQARA